MGKVAAVSTTTTGRCVSTRHILFVKVDAVVVLATSVTATTWVLAVLANATVTGRNVAALLPVLLQVGRLNKNQTTISYTDFRIPYSKHSVSNRPQLSL
jgi:hypothetical protein